MPRSRQYETDSPPSGSISSNVADTIAAIITPPGEGGIAAIRIAGPKSRNIVRKHFIPNTKHAPKPFLLQYGIFYDRKRNPVDEITAVYMPEGKSYTGLEQVELFCHGGRYVVSRILEELLLSGARMAEPGEFTQLAFLNRKIDLTKAEAIAEIIGSNTQHSYSIAKEHLLGAYREHIVMLRNAISECMAEVEASIDFSEEEIEPDSYEKLSQRILEIKNAVYTLAATYKGGKILKEGFAIAISGRPNAGKSSLFNLLLRQERALVTPTAGTTRDYLSEWIDLDGIAVNLIDTAGLRQGGGKIEQAGKESARKMIKQADLVLWMVDATKKQWKKQFEQDISGLKNKRIILAVNKIDLLKKGLAAGDIDDIEGVESYCLISCKTGKGIDILRTALVTLINKQMPDLTSGLVVTSARHQQKLKIAENALHMAAKHCKLRETPEIIAFDLRQAANAIDEITGKIYNEEILEKIFSKFCIGK